MLETKGDDAWDVVVALEQGSGQRIDGHDNPRNIAYIDADGTDLQVIAGVDARHPRLRPRP